jgi:hypothetical protein
LFRAHWLGTRFNSLFAPYVALYGILVMYFYRSSRSRCRFLIVSGGMPVRVLSGLDVRSTKVWSVLIGAFGVLIRRLFVVCSAVSRWPIDLSLRYFNRRSCNTVLKPRLRFA